MCRSRSVLVLLLYTSSLTCKAQELSSDPGAITQFPTSFLSHVQSKASGLDAELTRQSGRYLERLFKQEARLQKKLAKKDSAAAAKLTAHRPDYQQLLLQLKSGDASLSTSQQTLTGSTSNLSSLLQKNTQACSKQAYYYSPHVQTCKDELNNADKLTQRAMGSIRIQLTERLFFAAGAAAIQFPDTERTDRRDQEDLTQEPDIQQDEAATAPGFSELFTGVQDEALRFRIGYNF